MSDDPISSAEPKTPEEEQPHGVTLEEMEEHALKMLNRKMSEGRWYPRRHTANLFAPAMDAAADAFWAVLAWFWRFPKWIWRFAFGRQKSDNGPKVAK